MRPGSRAVFRLAALLVGLALAPSTGRAAAAETQTYAWVAFDAERLLAAQASGIADRNTGRALTVDDPVRVASVSKLVVALGVMRLVEQGRLDLDRDVSHWLGWRLRHPGHPDRAITLRMLLGHRSGLRDADDSPLRPGQTVRNALERDGAFAPERTPGAQFGYANLNYVVVGAVMERASGQRFDRLMRRQVLAPLGLGGCFGWTGCTVRERARGVTLYGADGRVRADGTETSATLCRDRPVRGPCRLGRYVLGASSARFAPQGGLRIGMADLARLGQLFLNGGRHRGQVFLRPDSLQLLVGPSWRFDGKNGDTTGGIFCAFGLGVQTIPTPVAGCKDRLVDGTAPLIGHPGEAYGLLSGLWIDRASGRGIAYFSANESGDRRQTDSAFYEVERALAGNIRR